MTVSRETLLARLARHYAAQRLQLDLSVFRPTKDQAWILLADRLLSSAQATKRCAA